MHLEEKHGTRVYIRVSAQQKEQLQRITHAHQATTSAVIRAALQEFLDKYAQGATDGVDSTVG
jgi:predicted transcriptional regulator